MTSLPTRQFLRTTSRLVALPVLGVLGGLVAAAVTTAVLPTSYEATGSVLVGPEPPEGTDEIRLTDVTLAQTLVFSVAQLAESREVTEAVATTLDVPIGDVVGHLHGISELGTQIVQVEATASTGPLAAAMADAAVEAMSDLSGQLNLGGSTVTVKPLDTAGVPTAPVSPKPQLNYALGALVGLLVGVGAQSLRRYVGDRFQRVADIEVQLGLPALGTIEQRVPRRGKVGASELYARPEVGKAIDGLVSALSVLVGPQPGRRIVVTGVGEEESAAYVAALLAVGLQHPERGTTVLEGMLSHPAVHRYFPGQVDQTADDDDADTRRARRRRGGRRSSPSVLTLGDESENLVRGTHFEKIGALVDKLAGGGDDVVVRAPSALAGRGLATLADHADVVILVVDSDRARRADAGRAALLVQRLDVPLAGLVVIGSAAEEDGWQASSWPAPLPISRDRDAPGALAAGPDPGRVANGQQTLPLDATMMSSDDALTTSDRNERGAP